MKNLEEQLLVKIFSFILRVHDKQDEFELLIEEDKCDERYN